MAETLSKAKNTSVGGMVEAGIVASRAGKVRLLKTSELSTDWDPANDSRLTAWEMVHHLIRLLETNAALTIHHPLFLRRRQDACASVLRWSEPPAVS